MAITCSGMTARLDKLGLKGQRVDELTADELGRLEAGAWFADRYRGEHVLTLEDAFAIAKGKVNLYLDCKHVDLELLARDILAAGDGESGGRLRKP